MTKSYFDGYREGLQAAIKVVNKIKADEAWVWIDSPSIQSLLTAVELNIQAIPIPQDCYLSTSALRGGVDG